MEESIEQWMEDLLKLDTAGDKMTEKQTKILQSAIALFAEKGYSASSTSEIAQRAGVAEGTIFRHYKTKKDLLLAIVAPAMTKLIAPFVLRGFNKVLDTEYESYDQLIRSMIENRIEFLKKHKSILKILVQEIPFHPELQASFQRDVLAKVLERLSKLVAKFQAQGKLIELPTTTIVRLTVSTIIGYVLVRSFYGERPDADWDDDREREETIAFIMRGLGIS
ncbi:TetR family transcriptional regulator [Paenibacillus baekrokdamisoli]|uniref:TetR family transcriptional regulator n=1 Tax=Paenibacillus baekrokdamisoli TaxID=1712516 RepID=A0A3G9IS73_9BACL|nr:TetR/AcrR family transcriptional regulator [Paenibacillus baekrokdamisoli]MBB3070141.1 AcrR family transcriptional regulator [Paenibacillus baekrokdamisoli]BBH21152.1 TetR family transcriptional regulator [Paenibacillus baekrokdamisoli]